MNGQDDQNQQQGTQQPQPASMPQPQPAETPYVRPAPTVMPGELDTLKKGLDK